MHICSVYFYVNTYKCSTTNPKSSSSTISFSLSLSPLSSSHHYHQHPDRNLFGSCFKSFDKWLYSPNSSLVIALMGCTGYFLLLPTTSLCLKYVEVSRSSLPLTTHTYQYSYSKLASRCLRLEKISSNQDHAP